MRLKNTLLNQILRDIEQGKFSKAKKQIYSQFSLNLTYNSQEALTIMGNITLQYRLTRYSVAQLELFIEYLEESDAK
jgi:hypothetical protein